MLEDTLMDTVPMRFRDCLMWDRPAEKPSLRLVLDAVLFQHSYRAVWFLRLSQYFLMRSERARFALPSVFNRFLSRFFFSMNVVLHDVEISPSVQLGRDLVLAHANGVVIGRDCRIGKYVILYQRVTLGARRMDSRQQGGYPIVEDGAVIYAGAIVVGPVTIGEEAVVGANALALSGVQAGSKAVGNPAVIK